jgi:GntR family transcriptional regulator, vanillate catabolism transcriptional regulator
MNQEETTYIKLHELLLNGDLEPGSRLTEKHVCDLLDVSRTPVRAALLRLEAQNLVIGQDNRGYSVRGITVHDVWNANVVRAVLEGAAAGSLAAHGVSEAQRLILEHSIDDYSELAANIELTDRFLDRHMAANRMFHKTIVAATCNNSFARSIDTLAYMPVQISRTVFASDRAFAAKTLSMGLADHRGVLRAILAGDATAAEMLMRTHSQTALRGIEQIKDRQKMGADYLAMPFHQFLRGVSVTVDAA